MFSSTALDMELQPSSSSLQGSQPCRHFDFNEIQLATNHFDESLVIGRGGFGTVYKGDVFNGSSHVVAAIKRLDSMSNQGALEFCSEVDILSHFRHCNLVSLIDHLHRLGTPLSWLQRLNICIGAARGLHYLHTGTGIQVGIIHRDVKTSNILLHESWAAKISDFGLSRVGPTNQPSTYVNTLVKGTFGYLDPDYFFTGRLTRKSDVYAFGVVLLEVLCRKRAVDATLDEEQWNLARWAQESIEKGNLKHIVDSNLKGQISPKCLKEFVRIAERCLHNNSKQRSTMAEVVVGLESILTLQEKFNSSLHHAGKTISRMVDMIPFPYNGENSDSKISSNAKGTSKQSSNTKGNHRSVAKTYLGDDQTYKIQSIKQFKFADLERATSEFNHDQLLGEGGYGEVFVGWVDKNTFAPSTRGVGKPIAVKRLKQSIKQVPDQWQVEVSLLGRLAHPNIVTLLGYCINEKENEYLIVYEYTQNQSFDRFLYPKGHDTAIVEPLSWGTRLSIMIGVAQGLTYLHLSGVTLCGVRTNAILLDQNFNAKLGDFELARSSSEEERRAVGTMGNLDPHYYRTGLVSVKTDIYGFGVVLLETLTGLKALDTNRPDGQQYLVTSASPILAHKEKLKNIIDPCLEQSFPAKGVSKYAELTLRCLADEPNDRPSSYEVLQSLKKLYAESFLSLVSA
ncbi:hypothetical protein OSB04_014854 [Centaurea solstitialis]|uniref:Protein kinase domain-containing protein n=1 Tax=Centaurea solstitialis TaxID=347529 RepID=A0AA38SZG3_9ASTR|nr:hypothetical protein OSB04_014854 [Centaurea solstitialis]